MGENAVRNMRVKAILEIYTYINDVDTKGVLLTSNTAMRPLYRSSPSLYDTANLSPEASHAIFSIIRLKNSDKLSKAILSRSFLYINRLWQEEGTEPKIEIRIHGGKKGPTSVIQSDGNS